MLDSYQRRAGLICGAISHVMWGLFPLFWRMLKFLDPLEVVCHRVVWAWFLLMVALPLLLASGGAQARQQLWRNVCTSRVWLTYAMAAVLIATNWLVFIWAVGQSRVLEASLGYYINPLLNVLLGVIVLRETLSRTQWLAVTIAAIGVGIMTLAGNGVPWISMLLALTFSLYGLVKKNAPMPPLIGLLLETTILVGPALLLLSWFPATVRPAGQQTSTQLLLVVGGLITIMPLGLFAFAAKRVPLSTLGILQYIGPTLQFLIGVLILKEEFGTGRIVGFICVWIALMVYLVGTNLRSRDAQPAAAQPVGR